MTQRISLGIRDDMMKAKRSVLDFVVVGIIVALTVIMGAAIYARRTEAMQSRLLMRELAMLRSSLILYKMINHENAESLGALESGRFEAGGIVHRYVDPLPVSGDGKVIDPFGNPYRYDRKRGWVSSTTGGFERW